MVVLISEHSHNAEQVHWPAGDTTNPPQRITDKALLSKAIKPVIAPIKMKLQRKALTVKQLTCPINSIEQLS